MEKSKMDKNNEAKNKDEKKKGTQLTLSVCSPDGQTLSVSCIISALFPGLSVIWFPAPGD